MAKFPDLIGTIQNLWRVGLSGGGSRTLRFFNGFNQDLVANPTAARSLKLPDLSGSLLTSDSLVPVNSSRTLALSDQGQFLACDTASAIVITVPDESVPFPIGSFIEISQTNISTLTINAAATVNIRRYSSTQTTGHVLGGQYSVAVLKKVGANEWRIFGGINSGTDLDAFRRVPLLSCDFLIATGSSSFDPFLGTAVSGGGVAGANAGLVTNAHPGVIRARSSTTANSGFLIGSSAAALRLGGGEIFEAVINFTAFASSTFRIGFSDATTSADAVDGAYFELNGSGAIVGKTSNNSTRTTSATIATLTAGAWYRLKGVINSAATACDFLIYDDTNALIGSTTVSGNIPTASGRETGIGVIGTNSGVTATDLYHLDYLAYGVSGAISR